MDFLTLATYTPLLATAGYTIVLVGLLFRQSERQVQHRWFLAFLTFSALWNLAFFYNLSDGMFPNLFFVLLLAGNMMLWMTTSYYVDWNLPRRWILIGAVLLLALVLLDVFLPQPVFPRPDSLLLQPSLAGLLGLGLWLLMTLTLLGRTWYSYRKTRLPWHANRLLHWFLFLALTFTGEALVFFNEPALILSGLTLCFLGVWNLSRAISSHQLFDVQKQLRRLFGYVLVVAATLLPAGLLLWVLSLLASRLNLPPASALALYLPVIVLGFLLYLPYRRVVERILNRFLLGRQVQTARVVRSYSQAISRTLDVEQLAHVIIDTIGDLLETNRGALMLVTQADEVYTIEPIPAAGPLSHQKKLFPAGTPLMQLLTQEHKPLLQYDVDFNPQYATLGKDERNWLADQDMEVYVPIIADGDPAGFIALGPKYSGRAYQPDELELVQVLADQTVIALQNARLYSALNEQNEHIRKLNQDLLLQNERLEILDKVKTDFITIASHELRTPLTQVKGYADILQAMNEEQDLTREQIREIMNAIERASLRLEKLITAMLDASQLEVSGMELSFLQTSLETVVHLAVEPYYPALHERHLKFSTSGLDGIPPLQADFKRLVQAFNNLIGNAIKYTPDFGAITISASPVPSKLDAVDFVEIIVADTGIGIDPEYHELIFEKFFRIGNPELHSTGSTKFKGAGPGLGLNIVKGVVEAHGGRIWVESYGQDEDLLPGSHFHIVLPLVPPAAQQNLGLMERALTTATKPNGQPGRADRVLTPHM